MFCWLTISVFSNLSFAAPRRTRRNGQAENYLRLFIKKKTVNELSVVNNTVQENIKVHAFGNGIHTNLHSNTHDKTNITYSTNASSRLRICVRATLNQPQTCLDSHGIKLTRYKNITHVLTFSRR